MQTRIALFVVFFCAFPSLAAAESLQIHSLEIEASHTEISSPGRIAVLVRIHDQEGKNVGIRRLPSDFVVRVTRNHAPVLVGLEPSSLGPWYEGELSFRESGRFFIRARVDRESDGQIVAQSDPVTVTAVTALDYGTIQAGETACLQLPGGGRGILGKVIDGELTRGLKLWGGCLIAHDNVGNDKGQFRARIAVQRGPRTQSITNRFYDISYQTEKRFLTPKRTFYLFTVFAFLTMGFVVSSSLRKRRTTFGPGAMLAWTEHESSPYRGSKTGSWQFFDLEHHSKRRSILDIGVLLGISTLSSGELKVRPADEGMVEFLSNCSEELRATLPDGSIVVGKKKLTVPYGSFVSLRSLLISPRLDDEAIGASQGSTEFRIG